MKWYKDPAILGLTIAIIFWCCFYYVDISLENQKMSKVEKQHRTELQEVADMAYKMGKQVARNDCRRVRDKEEENAPK